MSSLFITIISCCQISFFSTKKKKKQQLNLLTVLIFSVNFFNKQWPLAVEATWSGGVTGLCQLAYPVFFIKISLYTGKLKWNKIESSSLVQ